MFDFFQFFSDDRFLPKGELYLWDKQVLWLHILSDAGIALAYFAIPAVLFYFIRQRKDVPYPWVFVLFGVFIFACGMTHLFSIYTIWHPEYAVEGIIKTTTAVISLATAVLLIPLLPRAMALQSPGKLERLVHERTAELEQLNEALRSSQERGRLVIEAAPNGMIMINPDGNIILLNSEIEKLFGYERSELMGQPIRKLIPELFDENHPANLEANFRDPKTRAMSAGRDLFGRRKDGTEFPVEIGLNPLNIDEGTFVLAAIVDITGRKQAEKELYEARDAAEAASLAKSEFLAHMSHEIRTPLNGVFGMLGLLLDCELKETEREYAETARNSAETLLRLINDILDFSRIEANQLDIESEAFDLQHLVEETADMFSVRAQERGIDLFVRYRPEIPTAVVGDPGRIRQVLTNLVSNAIKFTQKGHILIDVNVKDQPDHGVDAPVKFHFRVIDTGIGVAADLLDEVFEKFVQQDSSPSRKFGGAGLGLAISRELVELMGGQIGVSSRLGKGSTFWFTLTLPPADDSPASLPRPEQLRDLRILIVDHSEINLRIVEERVKAWGMRSDTCLSGWNGLEALRQAHAEGDPFQFVIVDHIMAEMDGEEFAQVVNADPDLKGTILVLLTSAGQKGESKRLEAVGFHGYLLRPAHSRKLMGVLETLWSARQQDRLTGLVTSQSVAQTENRRAIPHSNISGSPQARILVAEDNPINQLVAVRMLEALGCSVDVAADGLEAIQMSDGIIYDLIFMDCQMPQLDGYYATREIRKRQGDASTIPIIAMTAHAMGGEREKCLKAGMDDYLSKPVLIQDFKLMLDKYLPNRDLSADESGDAS